jgi:DNA-binding SARP family transcriptional activator
MTVFEVLGPMRVSHDGESWNASARQHELALGILTMQAGNFVSLDTFQAEVWGKQDVNRPGATIQVYVSYTRTALRKIGADPDSIVTGTNCYMLSLENASTDVQRFTELLGAGREAFAGRLDEQAEDLLTQAQAVWRGPVLSRPGPGPMLNAYAAALRDMRAECQELVARIRMRQNRHREVVSMLHLLIAENPYRESLYGLLMVALSRSGFRAEAMHTYRRLAILLREELGLDPTRDLVELNAKLIRDEKI